MSDKPNIGGYEWALTCPCGCDISTRGMSATDSDGKWIDRNKQPLKHGKVYECPDCGERWKLKFENVE